MANEKAMLFLRSGRPIVGREAEAIALWKEMPAWLDAQAALGFFTRWDGFWLTPHGGDLNCAFMCFGERIKLDEWRRTDAFEQWVFRAANCLQNLGVVPGVTASAATEVIARRANALATK